MNELVRRYDEFDSELKMISKMCHPFNVIVRTEIGRINLFPMPDSDTGNNMSNTMRAGTLKLVRFANTHVLVCTSGVIFFFP